MWIFGRHRHLSTETLSEYLDGRLYGGQREKASRQLHSCASCREELEGLRATIALLSDLPDLAVPRTFTLAAPPPVVTVRYTPRPFRAPSWAYAGAASLAGLALAVMVSADATGFLTAPSTSARQGTFAAQTPGPTPAPQPTSAPAPAAASSETLSNNQTESVSTPQPESMEALRAAQAPKSDAETAPGLSPPAPESDQASATEEDALAFQAAPAPQPTTPAQQADSAAPGSRGPSGQAGPAGPSGGAATEGSQQEESGEGVVASSEEEASSLSETKPEPRGVTGPPSLPGPTTGLPLKMDEARTPLVWRVLEGIAAVLLVLFLTVLVWQRRKVRRWTNG